MRLQWVYREEKEEEEEEEAKGDVKTSHVYRENRDEPL